MGLASPTAAQVGARHGRVRARMEETITKDNYPYFCKRQNKVSKCIPH
jgi:hypothetical protein